MGEIGSLQVPATLCLRLFANLSESLISYEVCPSKAPFILTSVVQVLDLTSEVGRLRVDNQALVSLNPPGSVEP